MASPNPPGGDQDIGESAWAASPKNALEYLRQLGIVDSQYQWAFFHDLNANFRIKNDDTLQIRETSPTPGWRTIWLEDGAIKVGPLE